MSALERNPIDQNFQSPLNFSFSLKRAPSLTYFAQTVKLPDVGFPAPILNTPSLDVPLVGDHLKYEPLTVTFKVDEDFQNWFEMFNWIVGITDPTNSGKTFTLLENNPDYMGFGLHSDIQLFIRNGSQIPTYVFTFERAFPTYLSGMDFTTKSTDLGFITATVTFAYLKFTPSLP